MNFLFRQVDIAVLVFFRIVFGLLMCIDMLNTFFYDYLKKNSLAPDQFHFQYYGFEWIHPLPEPGVGILLLFLSVVSIFIMVGKWYRLSCSIFAIGFCYLFFLEKAHYLNHAYLVCWLSFLMVLLPAHRAFSFDVLKRPQLQLQTIPYWPVFLLQFMMGIVYFFGGLAKINVDWLNAMPLQLWLKDLSDMPVLGPVLAQRATAYFMSYGGLLLDCFIVLFLSFPRTRIWALAAAIFFHSVNVVLFNIGIFPFLSLALTLMYFSPDLPRKGVAFFSRKSKLFHRLATRLALPFEKTPTTSNARYHSALSPQSISMIIVIFCTIHCLIPFRQHLYPGHTAWTEEGHRYSWRMLLRSKRATGSFTVKNSETKKQITVNPKKYLSAKQKRKMLSHPDMILQFAHFLRDEYQAKGWSEVEVYASIQASLNGRSNQRYIDPSVNLAKEEWHFFKASPWIIPLQE
ncbi:MAG: HTTM domain-containing protein [Saprospiraceae bacterium]